MSDTIGHVYIAEKDGTLYACPETDHGHRCGACGRGIFQSGSRHESGWCKVCGAEHWIAAVRTVQFSGGFVNRKEDE